MNDADYERLLKLAETNAVIENAMAGGGDTITMLYRIVFAQADRMERMQAYDYELSMGVFELGKLIREIKESLHNVR